MLAVPRVGEREFAAMQSANAGFEAALDRGDVDRAPAEDDRFHAVLVQASANREKALRPPSGRRLEGLQNVGEGVGGTHHRLGKPLVRRNAGRRAPRSHRGGRRFESG
jgi:FCD domain